ncbi:QWRF motif-containing protein 7 [Magnolia sinica]|uniref:QWRF motif-containing protein 7 n=1 Tax=Magnolia sinica TaxID=86752 RepID=UPI002659341F|nr:QWRF motif-containing protein 7 [Magnolia sinica]
MESNRRTTKSVVSLSPRLRRSRSGAPAIFRTSTTESHPLSSNSPINPINRSKSTSKTHPNAKDDENRNPKIQEPIKSRKPPDNRENLAGIFHHHRKSDAGETAKPKKTRRVAGSPSAWALSPGRSPAPAPESSEKQRTGGVSGVLRFFRQKKTPSARGEAVHQLRILQTRLLQWRFVNARAESAAAAGKSTAEKKIFSVWLENFQLRNFMTEKRIQIEKLKEELKLHRILCSQIPLLNEWEKIDKRNLEAITKSTRLLRSASIKVPLVEGAKVDMFSVYTTICMAMDVIEGIEAAISRFYLQAKKMSSLLTELVTIVKQERESMDELMKISATVASLEAKERSLRVHLIQAKTNREEVSHRAFCRFPNRMEHVSFPLQASISPTKPSQTSIYVQ